MAGRLRRVQPHVPVASVRRGGRACGSFQHDLATLLDRPPRRGPRARQRRVEPSGARVAAKYRRATASELELKAAVLAPRGRR